MRNNLREKLRALSVGSAVYLEDLNPRFRNQINAEINRRRTTGESPLLSNDLFKSLLCEATVKAHGRTYITVSLGTNREYQFGYDTGRQKTEYSADYNIYASREDAEEAIRTPFLFFAVKSELSKYPAYGSWNNAGLAPAKVEELANVLGVDYDWVKVQNPPCYIEEKDNPYPLCEGRGMPACAHCGIWKDYNPEEDEKRAVELHAKGKPSGLSFSQVGALHHIFLWDTLIKSLPRESIDKSHGMWTDGDCIFCRTENEANTVANFIEAIGYECVKTGYYNPAEDKRDNCEDGYTGFYYVCID